MSGICGIYGKGRGGDIDAMTRVLSHRGPDDMGFYIEGPMQMGVRRLSIIDVQGGHQPLSNENQDLWVMLDGEVFNYQELRDELKKKGHRFKTDVDTEVIAHAWEEWGEKCLERFNGQFAIAVWEGERIHLARDRIGEKPLYYYQRGGRLLFGSEIKSLLTQISAEQRFTDELRDFETPILGDTLFKNVRELLPGSILSFDGDECNISNWWEIPSGEGPYSSDEEYIEELRWLLEDAVRLRLKGDVPVGMLLSGGLDSAIIACLGKLEHVYVIAFPEAGELFDELSQAKLIANRIKAKLHVIRPKPKNMRDLLPGIIWHLDQPVASMSSLAVFMAAREAKKKVKALLAGQGADELFGGHIRYLMMLAEDRLGSEPALAGYLPLARYFWSPEMFDEPADRYYTVMNRGPGVDPRVRAKIHQMFSRHKNLIDKMGCADLQIALPTVLAMDDRATAAYGLENRNPFLDHRIIELAFRLPPHLKVDRYLTKVILRKAMRGIVPDNILARTDKMGLAVPVGRWFRKELKSWAGVRLKRFRERYEANFLNAAWDAAGKRGEFDRRDYTRICLELWMEIMLEKENHEKWDQLRLT
jgi:asparagine synthase (glutamine-hydrolysing)